MPSLSNHTVPLASRPIISASIHLWIFRTSQSHEIKPQHFIVVWNANDLRSADVWQFYTLVFPTRPRRCAVFLTAKSDRRLKTKVHSGTSRAEHEMWLQFRCPILSQSHLGALHFHATFVTTIGGRSFAPKGKSRKNSRNNCFMLTILKCIVFTSLIDLHSRIDLAHKWVCRIEANSARQNPEC